MRKPWKSGIGGSGDGGGFFFSAGVRGADARECFISARFVVCRRRDDQYVMKRETCRAMEVERRVGGMKKTEPDGARGQSNGSKWPCGRPMDGGMIRN